MDELLIDEKKYVSSKQAAKITGYAKDYIGQLCREGRVPARLVGRSWYVLESAIADHRFGPPGKASREVKQEEKQEEKEKVEETKEETPESVTTPLPATWDAPRYEAVLPDPLPTINRLEVAEEPLVSEDQEPEDQPETLLDSWRNWFDQVAEIEPQANARAAEEGEQEEAIPQEETHEDAPIEIPIRTVYDLPPRELLPHRASSDGVLEDPVRFIDEEETDKPQQRKGTGVFMRRVFGAVRIILLVSAVAVASTAVVGSGYIDKYVSSYSQASIISGVSTYEK